MRILQALFFPLEQPGGVSSMVPYIQEQFNQMDWEMELFSLPTRIRGKGSEPVQFSTLDVAEYIGHPVVEKYIQTYKDYVWWTQRRLTQTYDLIHAHHPIAGLVMKQLFPQTPVIITIHSSYEKELLLNGKIKEGGVEHQFLTSLYKEIAHKLDLIITGSNSFKQYLLDFIGDEQKMKVIPNGYDEVRFRPVKHDNQVPQIISVCRLVPAKGLDILLRACGVLKQRGHAFVLHIIGDGPVREELEQLATETGVYEETIFYGYMLHPEEFMPFFDIFALPSRAEAFGSVFAEAALCWLALVGTDVGGIAEQITDGENGLLVPVDDVNALADALEKLVTNPELRNRLAKAAQQKAKEQYSLHRVIEVLQSIYVQFGK